MSKTHPHDSDRPDNSYENSVREWTNYLSDANLTERNIAHLFQNSCKISNKLEQVSPYQFFTDIFNKKSLEEQKIFANFLCKYFCNQNYENIGNNLNDLFHIISKSDPQYFSDFLEKNGNSIPFSEELLKSLPPKTVLGLYQYNQGKDIDLQDYFESDSESQSESEDELQDILKQKISDCELDYIIEQPINFYALYKEMPEILRKTDSEGNSLLYLLSLKRQNNNQIIKILLRNDKATFLKQGFEINPLIMMTKLLDISETIPNEFLQQNIKYLDLKDELGKTVLDYAKEHGNHNIIIQIQYLISAGLIEILPETDLFIQDRNNRNLIHSIILNNQHERFSEAKTHPNFTDALNKTDKFGLSSFIMAAFAFTAQDLRQASYMEVDDLIMNQILKSPNYDIKTNKFDELFFNICQEIECVDSNGNILPDYYKMEKQEQIGKCLTKIYNDPNIDQNTKRNLFFSLAHEENKVWNLYKGNINNDPDINHPIGIELELVNLHDVTAFFPMIFIDKLYDVQKTSDYSVEPSNFMHKSYFEEIVSNPILNQQQFQNFMEMCHILEDAGTMVNNSTGLHIHINFNGIYGKMSDKILKKLEQKNIIEEEEDRIETDLLKQIITNFRTVQSVLQGFIRNGNLFNDDNDWSQLILPNYDDIEELLKFDSINDIINSNFANFGQKFLTLNLTNIITANKPKNNKGTIEFRCHEGSINPTIIKAWVNFIYRIADISIDQIVQRENSGKSQNLIQPYDNIEDLVYLLIADRDYQNTWSKELGLVPSVYDDRAEPIPGDKSKGGLAGKIAQEEIQKSPFYHSLQKEEILDEVTNPQERKELERMITLKQKYPDILEKEQLEQKEHPKTPSGIITEIGETIPARPRRKSRDSEN